MRGIIVEMAPWEPSEKFLQIQPAFCTVLGCLWIPFGTLFGAFWTSWGPFGLRQGPVGLPQAVFLAAFGSCSVRRELAEILTRTSENLQSFRRELAEVQPRTCRASAEEESAKNQPRTCRMNPRQNCRSRCAFFELTAFSDKRFNKIAGNKSGAAVSPLGGLQLNNNITKSNEFKSNRCFGQKFWDNFFVCGPGFLN